MSDEHTPTDPIPALRPAAGAATLEEEATPVVASALLEEEATPISASPLLEERTAVAPDNGSVGINLPRTGMEEVDAAISDLERAVNQLSSQERRLLAVLAGTFVSLFLPWFQLYNQGSRGPTTAQPGLEVVGLTGLLMLVLLVASLLARKAVDELLHGRALLAQRGLHALTILWLTSGIGSSPGVGQPWRYSFWIIVPVASVVLLILGLLGRLPKWSPLRRA